VGMAGVGKSRLLAEFLSAAAEGATVLTGRCLSYGQGIAFWPVREMLQSAAGWREEDIREQAVAKLADLLPGEPDAELIADRVGQLLGLSEVTASLPENFWALRRLLEELCRWRPLVVVVDDLHWAEPTLLELIDYLVSAPTQAPLLVLGAARPELFDARPDWAGGSEERIVVEPLGSGESTVLLDNLLGGARLPPAARDHVLTAAEGNPLFVEQMLAMLVDDGVLASRNGAWTLTRAIVPELLPASITALLAARLERLPAAQQRAIEAGAVVGPGVLARCGGRVGPRSGRRRRGRPPAGPGAPPSHPPRGLQLPR
jgi:predicted ATPase